MTMTPPLMRLFLYLSIMATAAALLLTKPTIQGLVRDGVLDANWLFLGPSIFSLLLFVLLIERFRKHSLGILSLAELLPALFGIAIVITLYTSSITEYRARKTDDSIGTDFVDSFSHHSDPRVRALAMLALSHYNLQDRQALGLIREGLLDKDPLVQHAAKLVIEETLGIRFKNDAEGTGQAKKFLEDTAASALLMRKGIP
jgi:hypothetical protein